MIIFYSRLTFPSQRSVEPIQQNLWNQDQFIISRHLKQMAMQQENHQSALEKDISREFTKFIELYIKAPFIRRTNEEKYKIASIFGSAFLEDDEEKYNFRQNTLTVSSEYLLIYNIGLAETIFQQFYKYERLLNETLTQYIHEFKLEAQEENDGENAQEQEKEKYFLVFDSGMGGVNQKNIGIRELKSSKIGKLETLIGTITRTTQVRPELIEGVFRCTRCNKSSGPIRQQFKYTCPKKCLNQNCDSKDWELDARESQLADFQQLRVQEDPNSIPPGGMPRSINVVVRNFNTEKAQPGDICKFVGYLCVAPDIISMLRPGQRTTLTTRNVETRGNGMEMEGVKGIQGMRQLNYKFMFIANNVIVQNRQYHDVENTNHEPEQEEAEIDENENKQKYEESVIIQKIFSPLTEPEINELKQLRQNPRIYEDLAESMFAGIYGHIQIKKAILLQLFGGVHKKTTKNKISIRGDINVLLVGDPSTAKSQFLKTVNKFVPRSVYTNGKTTSAAGLTASVVRDDQGNVSIQAGALMLADNGVCCIDQFDKMNLSDMTAIHEAMEQQTISIAKAGVHATLNARTSVLAAANPVYGRYDKSKNLQHNLNISPPIMSRFDLCFVICDESNIAADNDLCNFILKMHRQRDCGLYKKYNTKTLRFYMGVAKKLKPMLTNSAAVKLRECYLNIRKASSETGSGNTATVRQLQSIIRLSQALARLHLNLQVTAEYVEEAYRLILNSITRLKKPDVSLEQEEEEAERKENMAIQNVLEEQARKKREEKKDKVITLSQQVYGEMIANVLKIFAEELKLRKDSDMSGQNEIKLTQGNVVNYMISLEVDKNTIQNEEQEKNFRKILRGLIKKMIKDERMLMIVEDNGDENDRVLKLHPNSVHRFD